MKPQEVKPKAQTDWLGFRKGVRTYVQRASLMMPSPETATKATMSLHVTAEHMSSKFTLSTVNSERPKRKAPARGGSQAQS